MQKTDFLPLNNNKSSLYEPAMKRRSFVDLSLNSTGPTRTRTPTATRGLPRRLPREDPRAEVGVCGARRGSRAAAARVRRGSPTGARARPVQLVTSRTRTNDLSADFCALFLARMSVGDARVHTCTCTVPIIMINYRVRIYKIRPTR